MSDFSFYWHDYETTGADAARDRPSQFAGIRTDADFNVIGEPLVMYCQPPPDLLPQPEACLVTGITPQLARERGLPEYEFIRRIHAELAAPGTCGVGYNSIRFDDEVTRFTLYRNFYDPYAREWQQGNSRWDIIDMVRACRALRPEGIEWPDHEDGTPSFKLEHLSAANGIGHQAAHDALSDVHATIGLARLVKERQPKLFDYLFDLRDKRKVAAMLDVHNQTPVLHTSAMFPASRLCTSLVMPLALHPTNKNAVICFDLATDPDPLLSLDVEQVRERLFTPADQLPEGTQRIALKAIHSNRCPVIATAKLLDDTVAARLQLDLERARHHYKQLKQHPEVVEKVRQVFAEQQFASITDPEAMLYSGGFLSDNDKATATRVRNSDAETLRDQAFFFEDQRLTDMLFRYRARNFPDALSEEEFGLWEELRYQRLTDASAGASITLERYLAAVEARLADDSCSERDRQILEQLLAYGDEVLA